MFGGFMYLIWFGWILEREFSIDNPLVWINLTTEMIEWAGIASWVFEVCGTLR